MDKPISVGDLVVVAYPAICGCTDRMGHFYKVSKIWVSTIGTICPTCRDNRNEPTLYANHEGGWIASVVRLKRIPPLGELEGKKDTADKPITLDGQIERLRKLVGA